MYVIYVVYMKYIIRLFKKNIPWNFVFISVNFSTKNIKVI